MIVKLFYSNQDFSCVSMVYDKYGKLYSILKSKDAPIPTLVLGIRLIPFNVLILILVKVN